MEYIVNEVVEYIHVYIVYMKTYKYIYIYGRFKYLEGWK